jgi:DNA-binding NarL/FixJ family response regulator
MSERPRVVLALTPVGERAIEELVFGPEPAVTPVASAADGEELAELADEVQAEAVLLSPELSGLTAARCARVRARGLRVVGIALDGTGERALATLAADCVVRPPASRDELREAVAD